MTASSDRAGHSPLPTIATVLCAVYAGGVLGFFVLRTCPLPAPPTLSALNYAAPFLFGPLVLILPLAFVSGTRPAIALALAVLALFLVLYGPFFLPRSEAVPPLEGGPLSAMSFNLGFKELQPQQNLIAIAGEAADIVAVEELTPLAAQAFHKGLAELYPYTVLTDMDTGLLSRYPIRRSEFFQPAGTVRPALHAVLDVNGTSLEVIVVHPQPPSAVYWPGTHVPIGIDDQGLNRQIVAIAGRAAALPGPVLVMGDFNMSTDSPAYNAMAAVLRDSFREAGWGLGFTFPRNLSIDNLTLVGPLIRIDYIFHSEALYTEESRVVCQGGSDHCYLTARFRFVANTVRHASVRSSRLHTQPRTFDWTHRLLHSNRVHSWVPCCR